MTDTLSESEVGEVGEVWEFEEVEEVEEVEVEIDEIEEFWEVGEIEVEKSEIKTEVWKEDGPNVATEVDPSTVACCLLANLVDFL